MELTLEKDLIEFGNWQDFNEKLEAVQKVETEEKLCEQVGMDFEFYQRIIQLSINFWRESPTQSLFNGMALKGLQLPKEGELVFNNHLSQTRFLTMLCKAGITHQLNLSRVKNDDGKAVVINGTYALTFKGGHESALGKKINDVLQAIYLYFFFCRKKEGIKLPKKIYRGIRLSDIRNHPMFKEAKASIKDINKSDRRQQEKQIIDVIVEIIINEGLNNLYDTNLLSFTSSKTVAKYFANNEGIIVEVNTKDVEIITSELHDERFAVKDYYSNKFEREYIVRLSEEKLNVSNITISYVDYLIATNNPLAVNMFDHDDKTALYQLNGVNIKAYFVWTSNTTSAIRYCNMDEDTWGYSSKEFKDRYGFSPVISSKNLKDIKNFVIKIR